MCKAISGVFLLAILFGLGACGKGGEGWTELVGMSCEKGSKDYDFFTKNKKAQGEFGAAVCGHAGKVYAENYRCESGRVQVQCK